MGLSDEEVARIVANAAAAKSEPRPKFTDDDMARILAGVPRVRQAGGPGTFKSFLGGLTIDAPAEIVGGIGLIGDLAKKGAEAFGATGIPSPSEVLSEKTREGMQGLTGIEDPVNDAEKLARAYGRGTGVGVALAPIGGALGLGPAGIATEIGVSGLGAAAGEEFRQAAEDMRVGEGGQILAEAGGDLVTAVSAPLVGAAAIPRALGKAGRARKILEATPEMRELAKRFDVDLDTVIRVSEDLKSDIPLDPYGKEAYIAEAIEDIQEARRLFPPEEMPTLRQILNKRAGVRLANREKGLSRDTGSEFPMRIEGRRQASLDAISRDFEQFMPNSGAEEAIRAFDEIEKRRRDAVTDAWKALPTDNQPMIDARAMKAAAQQGKNNAALPEDVPKEVNAVLEWPDEVPFDVYHKMRSRALKSKRIGKRATADTHAQQSVGNLEPLLREMNKTIDKLPEDIGPEYQRALQATRSYYEDYDRSSKVVKGLKEFTQGHKIAASIRSSGDPAAEAARAVRLVDQEPGGLDGLKRVMIDDILKAEDFEDASFGQALKRLKRDEPQMRVVLGDEGYELASELLSKAKLTSVAQSGAASAAAKTGSNTGKLEISMAGPDAMTNPGGIASRIAMNAIRKFSDKQPQRIRLMREAMAEPDVAELLLRMPTERSLEQWLVDWNATVRKLEAGRVGSRAAQEYGGEK